MPKDLDLIESFDLAAALHVLRPSEYTAALIETLTGMRRVVQGATVLEIGSGSGVVLAALAGLGAASLCGIDREDQAIRTAEILLGSVGAEAELLCGDLWQPVTGGSIWSLPTCRISRRLPGHALVRRHPAATAAHLRLHPPRHHDDVGRAARPLRGDAAGPDRTGHLGVTAYTKFRTRPDVPVKQGVVAASTLARFPWPCTFLPTAPDLDLAKIHCFDRVRLHRHDHELLQSPDVPAGRL
jgi:hypothetical protein